MDVSFEDKPDLDREKFFWVTGRYHVIGNPISEAKIDQVIERLRLPLGGQVLDIACGKAEMLCRIAEQYGARCTGVERNSHIRREADERIRQRGLAERIEVREMDGRDFQAPEGSFDVSMCIGAEWVFGGLSGTLEALAGWTRLGGTVAVGTPFWSAEPPDSYLEVSGLSRQAFATHQGNIRTGEDMGLTLTYAVVSDHDDWDHYAGLSWSAAYDYIAEHPDDPDAAEIDALTERDKASYFGGGRDCLGWAIYLFRR